MPRSFEIQVILKINALKYNFSVLMENCLCHFYDRDLKKLSKKAWSFTEHFNWACPVGVLVFLFNIALAKKFVRVFP